VQAATVREMLLQTLLRPALILDAICPCSSSQESAGETEDAPPALQEADRYAHHYICPPEAFVPKLLWLAAFHHLIIKTLHWSVITPAVYIPLPFQPR
jgi:hypothetical protein